MAESSLPFYGVETQEDEFSDWGELLLETGVVDGLVVSAGSGMSVNVAAGHAFMRGRIYTNTSSKAVALTAAPGSGTRKDAIVLRIDFTAKTITATKKDGTTAGGGTLPSLQQDDSVFELLIATVTIASGTLSITAGNLADARRVVGSRVFPYAVAGDRPALAGFGIGINTTTKNLEITVDGGANWLPLKVDWANVSSQPTAPPAHTLDSHSGVLALAKGGTGATDAAGARTAIGAAAAAHDHTASQISDATALGRSLLQASSVIAARELLRIFKGTGPTTPSVDDLRYRDI